MSHSGRSNISSKYTISETSSSPVCHAGLWKIQRAARSSGGGALSSITASSSSAQGATTSDGSAEAAPAAGPNGSVSNNERPIVSVWSHNLSARARDRNLIIEVLKKEVSMCTVAGD